MNNENRVKCPFCDLYIVGVERIGGTLAVRYNRGTLTFERGTLPCVCGTQMVIAAGVVIEFAPPDIKPRSITMPKIVPPSEGTHHAE